MWANFRDARAMERRKEYDNVPRKRRRIDGYSELHTPGALL